jgi:monothiol glutaredoxin
VREIAVKSSLDRIRQLIDEHDAILFLKGTPEFPMCGYSAQAVNALNKAGHGHIRYVNIMADAELRANLPRLSNWPTFPQFFLHGELLGGADILAELLDSGELQRIVAELDKAA